jgi:hypothetical protein
MTKPFLSILLVILASCSGRPGGTAKTTTGKPVSTADTAFVWVKLSDSANWKKSYNFQLFSIRDTLWTFHHEGNWFSTNGTHWTKSPLSNIINNHAFLDYIVFNGAVLGLGHFEGNIEQFTFKPEIYQTTNFKNWVTLAKESNLPPRFFYHPFVFDNKIWLIGGEDRQTTYADIWNSADGIRWTKQKDRLPFGKRSNSQVVLLNGTLYLLDNDVWSSTDGLHWQKVTGEIVKGEAIFGYTAIVFDNKIWLLGCNRNGRFSSEVLWSEDGKNWHTQHAPWRPRGGIAAAVYQNKLYITGGKYGGTPNHPDFRYDNDVWALEKR